MKIERFTSVEREAERMLVSTVLLALEVNLPTEADKLKWYKSERIEYQQAQTLWDQRLEAQHLEIALALLAGSRGQAFDVTPELIMGAEEFSSRFQMNVQLRKLFTAAGPRRFMETTAIPSEWALTERSLKIAALLHDIDRTLNRIRMGVRRERSFFEAEVGHFYEVIERLKKGENSEF